MKCLFIGACVLASATARATACDDPNCGTAAMTIPVAAAAPEVTWQAASPVIGLPVAEFAESYVVARPIEMVIEREETVTVQRPVYETVEREERFVVRRPVVERSEREESYIVRRPVLETSEREERFVVQKPVYETADRDERVIVRRPVVERAEQLQTYSVQMPITTYRLVDSGCGTCTRLPEVTYAPQQVVRRVPIETVRYVDEVQVRKVPIQTVRYVEQQEVRKVPVQTLRYVEERVVRKVPVETVTYVEEQVVRKVPTVVCRIETRQEVRRVPLIGQAYVESPLGGLPAAIGSDACQPAAAPGATGQTFSGPAKSTDHVGAPTPAPALQGNDQPQSREAGRPAAAPAGSGEPTPAKPKQQEKTSSTGASQPGVALYNKLVPVNHRRVRQN
jgi:hypothetical protein